MHRRRCWVPLEPRAVPRFLPLTRLASLDVLFALLIGAATIVLSLTHPWTHAQIGEAQFGDAEYWDLGAESWARGYVAVKTPERSSNVMARPPGQGRWQPGRERIDQFERRRAIPGIQP